MGETVSVRASREKAVDRIVRGGVLGWARTGEETGARWGPALLLCAALVVVAPGTMAAQDGSGIHFTTWTDSRGVISADVPEGWTVEGGPGSAVDLGQFQVTLTSPDGRSFVTFAHNWNSFMEFQAGPYRPGHATIESFVLPSFLQRDPRYRDARVTYRGPVWPISLPSPPFPGARVSAHGGTLGFLLMEAGGRVSAGSAFAETMYLPGAGHPGLWRLRIFAAAVAPADPDAQARVRAALDRLVATLELDGGFLQAWSEAHERTVSEMRRYSADMARTFSRYLEPVARSRRGAEGKDPMQAWAEMMRGGEYAENPETGEQYWVPEEWTHAWVSPRGEVMGNVTGSMPRPSESLTRLRFRGR